MPISTTVAAASDIVQCAGLAIECINLAEFSLLFSLFFCSFKKSELENRQKKIALLGGGTVPPNWMCGPVCADDWTARTKLFLMLVARALLFGFHLTLIVPATIIIIRTPEYFFMLQCVCFIQMCGSPITIISAWYWFFARGMWRQASHC